MTLWNANVRCFDGVDRQVVVTAKDSADANYQAFNAAASAGHDPNVVLSVTKVKQKAAEPSGFWPTVALILFGIGIITMLVLTQGDGGGGGLSVEDLYRR